MKKNRAAVLVNSCDTYEDTWHPFFELFKIHWPDCAYPIFLNTESKTYSDEKLAINCFSLYQDNKVAYGERLLEHIKRIPNNFIIMMLDDFFLRAPVDSQKIESYLDFMEENSDVAFVTFDSIEDSMNIDDGVLEDCVLRPRCGEYKVNLQAGIWRRESLFRYVRKHESPWELETKGSIRSFECNDRFYCVKDVSLSPINYGKKPGLTWAIVRGKWVKDDVAPLFEQYSIDCDFSKRGFFEKDNFTDITVSKQNSKLICRLKSYGFPLALRMDCWRISRMICKILHKPYDVDWVAYRRRKHI